MSLFQNTVVKKYSNSLDQKLVEEKWQLFTTIFHNTTKQDNIRNSKEEQYQAIFLNDLFVQVLGYTQHPNTDYNLITEQKNETNSKKADGAIILNENVLAVIELKGTETTDLAKIENQAFGYKNNQKNCSYVIISNFEKLRFYIDNATEHIEFNLFTLSRAEFDLLYICLSLESMQTDLPKKIKNESVSNEDKITKELYKDYSAFRKELFNDIEQLNPQYDRLLLFKKTQKLLDRFLFIFFAEDRQLLPTNLIFSINLEWQKLREARVPVSLYDRYKMYFQDLNTGARVSLPAFGKHTNEIVTAQYDIYAYNGGLFQPDDILDTITINDDLLFKHTKKLSEYDFESEVDVNILGHIFENSLNEIDEITNAIEGQEVDKTKTKRKKDGVFYTPKYITKYIVDNTIGKLCEEKKTELALDETKYTTDKRITVATKKKLIETLDSYRKWLLQLTIVDPACGSGAFLNQALEFLIAEHKYVDELQAKLFGDALVLSDVEGSILENNLFGVDLNEESVEIAKLSLWLRTAQRNRKLNSLNNNIKCGNSLIDDATIAGDKAFNWHNEFPQVFANGGFDVVIGNPPYGAFFDIQQKDFISNKYFSYQYKFESYLYFYELGTQILKQNGYLSFITPELFLRLEKSENIRKHLINNSKIIEVKLCGEDVFQDVKVNSTILTLKNIYLENYKFNIVFENDLVIEFSSQRWKKSKNLILEYEISENYDAIIQTILKKSICLEKIGECVQGLTAYDSYRGHSQETIKQRAFHFNEKIDESCGKWLDGKNLSRYFLEEGNEWLKYGDWLAAPREPKFFENPRILFREIPGQNKKIQASYTDKKYYYGHSITPFILNDIKKFDVLYLLSIVNSNLLSWYASIKCSNFSKKTFPKLNPKDIKDLPIPNIKKIDQQPFIEKADLMLSLNKELQEVSLKFSKYFSGQFKLEKLSGKLEKWYDVTFEEFIKEINKAIKAQKGTPLTKKDEFDWIDLFEENKQKANALQTQIATTDKAIDAMVYELYGLNEEEIAIVEN
ncbi:MAG: N-6 DNA methylase [Flavobacterium sp.]|uniref:Eco57I restriction-modification methylase domain-containing protein n=1 Tax=Flavobacterium sp. TaxID=239 RepID=UPI0022CAE4C4|nr:N-6 DNA methylase [Flavobacterium sp.]MCZ8196751.1 N-6 DNA methylase [Flavobacterium sp.]